MKGANRMVTDLRDDVYAYLLEEKLNLDVIFDWDETRGLLINVRARPWKNNPNDGRMVLVAGRTIDEALVWLVRGLANGRWLPLNWSRRCQEIGIDKRLYPLNNNSQVRRSPTMPQELLQEPIPSEDSDEDTNGDEKAAHGRGEAKSK
jgi:hypothetical protein